MIKRIRRRFILLAILSVMLVLGLIIAGINIVNIHYLTKRADERIDMIENGGGAFPDRPEPPDADTGVAGGHISPEAPFDTRYFTVKFDTDGTVSEIDTGKIASVSDSDAAEYASRVRSARRDKGYIDRYRYRRTEIDGSEIYIFLNCDRELSSLSTFLAVSTLISAAGTLAVLLLLIILSGRILRPITESYVKQKQFITDAGHELKTPLTVISANTELIEMEHGESKWTEGIKGQVRHLAKMTEKLVLLSKMEEGASLDMRDMDLSGALREACELYSAAAISRGRSLTESIEDGVRITGDEGEIQRAFSLLFDNALRYSSEGGSISVSLGRVSGRVHIVFRNDCDIGKKGNLDILFERFYRMDSSRSSETGGSGIGLAVVRAIVEAHGGRAKAYSEDGKSLTVTLII